MRLIGSLTSPFVRKVRIVMAEKKLDYQLVLDNVWSADAQIAQANPLGKVPCLVMEGGEAIFDSRVIVEHLDTLSPVSRLIPQANRERVEVRTWEALADGVLDAALLAWLEQNWAGRQTAQRCEAWTQRQLDKVHRGLRAMSHGLAERPWCCGIHYSLADIAVGCALGWLGFRFPEVDWISHYPNLMRLDAKLQTRSSFTDTAPPLT